MKALLLVLILLFVNIPAFSQTYNALVPDSVITKFMQDVLTNKEPYQSAFNKLPKKVFYKPISLKTASWDLRELPSETEFEIKFDKLLEKVELTKEDVAFLKAQVNGFNDTIWNLAIPRISLKKKHKKNYFVYSVPIFTKDFKKAVFWRYMYCGSLCAYSELHTYKLYKGKWVIDEYIAGWIS
ncbi:hypothetical protein C8N40_11118 [Pontibacter mucosus]|uniref:Uncharacterized protein n=1 Tax=Pontibacter mucosus TaxID=1649266 RepID=A0A2T5YCX3_9BACT|nr:hypothetical protein [Pontibacter mucosus]PTX14354.1 hypothetical protein C8N40_11118 [Pontibacter mucosus]